MRSFTEPEPMGTINHSQTKTIRITKRSTKNQNCAMTCQETQNRNDSRNAGGKEIDREGRVNQMNGEGSHFNDTGKTEWRWINCSRKSPMESCLGSYVKAGPWTATGQNTRLQKSRKELLAKSWPKVVRKSKTISSTKCVKNCEESNIKC